MDFGLQLAGQPAKDLLDAARNAEAWARAIWAAKTSRCTSRGEWS